MSKTNRFRFVVNNYTPAVIEWFDTHFELFKYICYGFEVGEECGTPHMQGYLEFTNNQKKRITAVVDLFQRNGCPTHPNFKTCEKSAQSNIDYCSKQCIGGSFWERGERPKGQGSRSDIQAALDLMKDGGSLQDVAMEHGTTFVKYYRGLQAHQTIVSGVRKWKTEIWWLWGPTGSGKSRWAWETYPEAYGKNSTTKWWCGYMGQDTAIIDDFRPNKEMPFNYVLNLFDRYPMLLETKGGQVQCLFKTIVVTCPFSPEVVLSTMDWVGAEQGHQLIRRLDHVIQFPQIATMFGSKEC